MSGRQRFGWLLVASAGVVSSTLVGLEIAHLVSTQSPETAETLPVIGFEPVDD